MPRRTTRALRACAAALVAAGLVPAAAEGACSLNLTFQPCIEVTAPNDLSLGAQLAGTTLTSTTQSVVVSSNATWSLRVSSDASDGRMREWNGSGYVAGGGTLSSPLQWSLSASSSWAALSGTPAAVVTNRPRTTCVLGALCLSETVQVRLRQPLSFADRPGGTRDYRLGLTYAADHAF